MDSIEKKPKRPRIGENRNASYDEVDGAARFEKVDYSSQTGSEYQGERQYSQHRSYNRQGNYNNRYNNQGGYNNYRQGGYNNNNRYNNKEEK